MHKNIKDTVDELGDLAEERLGYRPVVGVGKLMGVPALYLYVTDYNQAQVALADLIEFDKMAIVLKQMDGVIPAVKKPRICQQCFNEHFHSDGFCSDICMFTYDKQLGGEDENDA